ncbi:uncharacterized protein LOC144446572 isoform X2 [Glandiceps talaboti]
MSAKSLPAADVLQNWTVQEVSDWLKSNNFNEFVLPFRGHKMDGTKLMVLTEYDINAMNHSFPEKKQKSLVKQIGKIKGKKGVLQRLKIGGSFKKNDVPAPPPAPRDYHDEQDDDDGWGSDFDDVDNKTDEELGDDDDERPDYDLPPDVEFGDEVPEYLAPDDVEPIEEEFYEDPDDSTPMPGPPPRAPVSHFGAQNGHSNRPPLPGRPQQQQSTPQARLPDRPPKTSPLPPRQPERPPKQPPMQTRIPPRAQQPAFQPPTFQSQDRPPPRPVKPAHMRQPPPPEPEGETYEVPLANDEENYEDPVEQETYEEPLDTDFGRQQQKPTYQEDGEVYEIPENEAVNDGDTDDDDDDYEEPEEMYEIPEEKNESPPLTPKTPGSRPPMPLPSGARDAFPLPTPKNTHPSHIPFHARREEQSQPAVPDIPKKTPWQQHKSPWQQQKEQALSTNQPSSTPAWKKTTPQTSSSPAIPAWKKQEAREPTVPAWKKGASDSPSTTPAWKTSTNQTSASSSSSSSSPTPAWKKGGNYEPSTTTPAWKKPTNQTSSSSSSTPAWKKQEDNETPTPPWKKGGAGETTTTPAWKLPKSNEPSSTTPAWKKSAGTNETSSAPPWKRPELNPTSSAPTWKKTVATDIAEKEESREPQEEETVSSAVSNLKKMFDLGKGPFGNGGNDGVVKKPIIPQKQTEPKFGDPRNLNRSESPSLPDRPLKLRSPGNSGDGVHGRPQLPLPEDKPPLLPSRPNQQTNDSSPAGMMTERHLPPKPGKQDVPTPKLPDVRRPIPQPDTKQVPPPRPPKQIPQPPAQVRPPPMPTKQPPPPPVTQPVRPPTKSPQVSAPPSRPQQKELPPPPKPTSSQMSEFEGFPYYHGPLDRERAAAALKETPKDGAFIVRDGRGGINSAEPYTISVWFHGKPWNLKICRRGARKFALGAQKTGEMLFDSPLELVQYHRDNSLVLAGDAGKVCLMIPAPLYD